MQPIGPYWRDVFVGEDVAVKIGQLDCVTPGTLHPS